MTSGYIVLAALVLAYPKVIGMILLILFGRSLWRRLIG